MAAILAQTCFRSTLSRLGGGGLGGGLGRPLLTTGAVNPKRLSVAGPAEAGPTELDPLTPLTLLNDWVSTVFGTATRRAPSG